MIILFFGQPGSGKTTLAGELEKVVSTTCPPHQKIKWIDGDQWREITKNKDYSREGRMLNLQGAFDLAINMESQDYFVILSFVAPYQDLRNHLKENSRQLIQIYLTYDEDRGKHKFFAPDFEAVQDATLIINTSTRSVEESIGDIKRLDLQLSGL
jgi:adenylylsulfate kinase-like enzyme